MKKAMQLRPTWRQNVEDYLIWREKRPAYKKVSGSLDNLEAQKSRKEFLAQEGVKKSLQHQGITFDQVTGRAQPYKSWYTLPYKIYHLPSLRAVRVDDQENYDEYLRIICQMLDAGVKVVNILPNAIIHNLMPYLEIR